jgi:molecular chaperone HtpG
MKKELIIGKYTLESLTNGMYSSPFDLYREYIQNSADSIDVAIKDLKGKKSDYTISIEIDEKSQMVIIKDNGIGVPSEISIETLVNIGNSNKKRSFNRGFRGIGRLAGLGYCNTLTFTTSSLGESKKTIVTFDAMKLRELLLSSDNNCTSVNDVIAQILSHKIMPEKANAHYFEVKMNGVSKIDGLLNEDQVKSYILQNAPLPFSHEFKWGSTIISKTQIEGYIIPAYNISLNGEKLYKPYSNEFVADRVKKIVEPIQDIYIKPFYIDDSLSAILWYVKSNYFGTVVDNSIKGIRIRQGNILIGDKSSCNFFFKEDRFNGWIIGELHVLDHNIIANSRRDYFELNEAFHKLEEQIKDWAMEESKEIRRLSYERNLTKEKQRIIKSETIDDENNLYYEDTSFTDDSHESDYIDCAESESLAEVDYIGKLSLLLNQKNMQTKYTALNINPKLTIDQRKILERVFDLILEEYDEKISNRFINVIAQKF